MLKFIFKVTFQSVILFFAVSFLTVLYDISLDWFNVPKERAYEINIGFPFQYYERFWVDSDSPNQGWSIVYLFYDCVLFWLFTFVIYYFKDRKNLKENNLKENNILDN